MAVDADSHAYIAFSRADQACLGAHLVEFRLNLMQFVFDAGG